MLDEEVGTSIMFVFDMQSQNQQPFEFNLVRKQDSLSEELVICGLFTVLTISRLGYPALRHGKTSHGGLVSQRELKNVNTSMENIVYN